jgi:hypothetical protein
MHNQLLQPTLSKVANSAKVAEKVPKGDSGKFKVRKFHKLPVFPLILHPERHRINPSSCLGSNDRHTVIKRGVNDGGKQ